MTKNDNGNQAFPIINRILYWHKPDSHYGVSLFTPENTSSVPDLKMNWLDEKQLFSLMGFAAASAIASHHGANDDVNGTIYGELHLKHGFVFRRDAFEEGQPEPTQGATCRPKAESMTP